ncbi:hypothetical protein KUV85_08375 [Nocardioides panacisoli]|uniref:hypothetical protein n=1 Tax=Nocardioides panacisoli TaxID=627624 RepID=UPI001C62F8B2|nr:hypothetical protein [Nocardioides panacisoli]QYJ05681.1 hypothetical protein KUV85_08375 [Nocardioides panacisoli]
MDVAELLASQDGVVARRQVLAAGEDGGDVARRLRRREWVVVHPGVYVDHTGPLTWQQRSWAAVLACWPAALAGWSAIRAHEGPGPRGGAEGPVEVVVAHRRRIRTPEGVVVRRDRHLDDRVQWNRSPPRMRYDAAVLALAAGAATDMAAVAVLADACGARRTTAARLRRQASATPRLRRRAWLLAVLDDVAEGTCSVLEHAYLRRVERDHGLPRGQRQVPAIAGGRRMMRDVVYAGRSPAWTQVVELDGRLFHSSAESRDRDLERDLDAALDGADTVRLGYAQVVARPCATAAKIAALLRRRGWEGALRPCADCQESSPGRVA